jgi:hypothetical protein
MVLCKDVEIEILETWPSDFFQLAIQSCDLILAYQRERRRIDRLCQSDVMARVVPPSNEHERDYNELLDRLDEALTQHRIVGYHCTRLTPSEIVAIKSTGLRILSPELVRHRLDRCVTDGYMTSLHRAYLNDSHTLRESLGNRHGNRTGMIWLCPNRSTLRQASGVYRLFRSWGGEAVYVGH